MKTSKRNRKSLNQLRALSDVPWPSRRFKYPPTFADGAVKAQHVGTCAKVVAEHTVQTKRRFRRAKSEQLEVKCGGRVMVRRGSLAKRRAYCESCRERRHHAQLERRLSKRIARLTPQEQAREQQREVSRLRRFMRKGA